MDSVRLHVAKELLGPKTLAVTERYRHVDSEAKKKECLCLEVGVFSSRT